MKLSTFEAFKHLSEKDTGMILLNETQLNKIHRVLVRMMEDITEICDKNSLCYFLGGGSALGALRHKGFIPWDDDMDINMPRRDYEKFIRLFREKYSEQYWIQTPGDTPNYGLTMKKIKKKGTVMRGRDDFHSEECGVGIDIFIIENMFENRALRLAHGVLCLGMGYLLSCRKFYRDRKEMRQLARAVPELGMAFRLKIGIGFLLSVCSLDWWCRMTDRCHSLCKNNHSTYVSGCAGRLHFFGEMYRRDGFCRVRKAEFEGHWWNVPVKAEEYLTHCYGDWKKLPAPEKREKHFVYQFECEV